MAKSAPSGPILITGSSSGIGRSSALALHAAGRTVYASARRLDSIKDLADQGIRTLALDVTDEESMTTAVAAIEAESGPIAVLINNAGYGLYGAVEQGRILNVSSMGGRVTLPGGAFYHASKYAVEAFSDALRMEVAQFGIDVVLIEPGPVKTPWNDVAAGSMDGNGAAEASAGAADDPYAAYKKAVAGSFTTVQDGPLARLVSTADDIAEVIVKAVTAGTPRTRYLINAVAKSMLATRRLLPTRASDALLARQYGLPR